MSDTRTISERIRQPYATLAQRKASERTALILGICDGMEPVDVERALRIGRAVLACELVGVTVQMQQGTEFIREADVLLRRLLAAGDDE